MRKTAAILIILPLLGGCSVSVRETPAPAASMATAAAGSGPGQTLVNPPGTERTYRSWKFSQAVRAGDTVWVSGQVGSKDGKVQEGIEAQARTAFERLRNVLAEAGATLDDVVELTTYHTSMKDLETFSRVKAEFFTSGYPAWTAVGVTELALPGFLVEVQATAVVGSGKNKRAPGIDEGGN